MRGDKIPLTTVYTITGKGITKKRKEPLYKLVSAEEEKAHQDKLGDSVSFWYGTWCKKCCGVYPKFFTTESFDDKGYYVCLVCGKESKHTDMTWQARDAWNNGDYIFNPEQDDYQMTIFDYL